MTRLDDPVDGFDEQELAFLAAIRQHGWFDTHIAEEPGLPGFSFTTGFWLEGKFPEVVLFSLPDRTCHDILWGLFRGLQDGGIPVVGEPAPLFGSHKGVLLPVAKGHYAEHLGWSRWFYGGDDFPCLQLFWPDRTGRFPWEPGFDPDFVGLQPNLTERAWPLQP